MFLKQQGRKQVLEVNEVFLGSMRIDETLAAQKPVGLQMKLEL